MEFKSYSALEKYLLSILADCMNEVGLKVNRLLRIHIQEDVYNVGRQKGRKYYYNGTKKPTGQLKESVTNTKPEKVKSNEIEVQVYHNTNKMEYDAGTYLHGSAYYTTEDVRDMLPYWINEGLTGGLFGATWERLKRPYYTNTLNELVEKKLIRKWMLDALAKRGIKAK